MAEEKNTETDAETVETEKLSIREALEVALEADNDTKSNEGVGAADSTASADTTETANKAGAESDAKPSAEEPPLQPPAELTAEEKADFAQLSRKQQEAQLRLHKSRSAKLEEIKRESQTLSHIKKIAETIDPYVKARGAKETADVAIQKAVAFYFEAKENPKGAAVAILKAHGVPVPSDLLEEKTADPLDAKITPLQNELNALKSRVAQEDTERAAAALTQVWTSFEQSKNAAGGVKYPDIQPDKGEAGLKLAAEIGSLVHGKSQLSQQFIATVSARNPNTTYETLIAEAYKFLGGRIDDSVAPKTQSNSTHNHLHKSNRAASSVPGRGVSTSGAAPKKFKSYREALEAARADLES